MQNNGSAVGVLEGCESSFITSGTESYQRPAIEKVVYRSLSGRWNDIWEENVVVALGACLQFSKWALEGYLGRECRCGIGCMFYLHFDIHVATLVFGRCAWKGIFKPCSWTTECILGVGPLLG